MVPFQIIFTGYAIIGLTLLVLAAAIAIYLLRLPSKSQATRALIAFFFMVALSGAAVILTNGIYPWDDFFAPWQDFWILAGGIALAYFAYSLPRYEASLEARAALFVMSILALMALAYTIAFDYRFLFERSPELVISDAYYLLLPVGILFIVIIFLRRSVQMSERHQSAASGLGTGSIWLRLVHPQSEDARTARNLALALSLAFLPGLQTVVGFPYPLGFILSNIGSILAITAIALVYFNYAPEITSFMAKLVGVTLATLLLIFAVAGSVDVYVGMDLANGIGLSGAAAAEHLSTLVSGWLVLILGVSAFVLLVFPLFFRRTLVQPLKNLLLGVKQVEQGFLDSFVPIRFHDEIGSLTASFNTLIQSLKLSRTQQEELYDRLQASYEELEKRVSDRTRELSAFTDLTMLPGDHDDLVDILQPALNRIMEVGLCQALCVHLLVKDRHSMALVAHRNLSEMAVEALENVLVPASFVERLQQLDDPILSGGQKEHDTLPSQLRISQYPIYLGSPLVAGEQTHGWLSCYRQAEDDFVMGEIALLVALARQMGVIVENQRLRRRIKDVAAFEERRRLARDLHDSVTQLIYSMTLFTRSSQEALEDGDSQRLTANLSNLANTSLQALREMRVMLFELQLQSLESGGLVRALNTRFDMVERRVGIHVTSQVDLSSLDSKRIEKELYYVALEALNNTVKHAGADQVDLQVTRENGSVRLCVTDNGRGFDPAQVASGLGLNNMRQRIGSLGGDLRIDSVIDQGTSVTATIPVRQ
jgi:signal transduction histidine kinase